MANDFYVTYPVVSGGGQVPFTKYTISYTDLLSFTGQSTAFIPLVSVPAGTGLSSVFLNVTQLFNGGTLSSMSLLVANDGTLIINTGIGVGVSTAEGNPLPITAYWPSPVSNLGPISLTTTQNLGMAVSLADATCDQLTQGSFDIYFQLETVF